MPSNQIRWCAYEKEDKHERSDQDRSAGNIMYRNWYDQPGVFCWIQSDRSGKIRFFSADRQCWSYLCTAGGQPGYVDWLCYGAWGRNLRIVPRKQPSCLVLHSYGTSGISCGWHSKCGIDRQLQDPGTDCHLGNHVCGKGNRECTDEGRTVLSAAG